MRVEISVAKKIVQSGLTKLAAEEVKDTKVGGFFCQERSSLGAGPRRGAWGAARRGWWDLRSVEANEPQPTLLMKGIGAED